MSYDLHVTRTGHWADSETKPILRAEWEAFARNDSGLSAAGEISRLDTEADPVFEFTCDSGEVVSLYWRRGHVLVTGLASAKAVSSLRWLAEDLDARLVGDDGESY
jgi:hypothetical protein